MYLISYRRFMTLTIRFPSLQAYSPTMQKLTSVVTSTQR